MEYCPSFLVKQGNLLLLHLEDLEIVGALWFYLTDKKDWYLYLISPQAKDGGKQAFYKKVMERFPKTMKMDWSKITAVDIKHPIYKELLKIKDMGLHTEDTHMNYLCSEPAWVYFVKELVS